MFSRSIGQWALGFHNVARLEESKSTRDPLNTPVPDIEIAERCGWYHGTRTVFCPDAWQTRFDSLLISIPIAL